MTGHMHDDERHERGEPMPESGRVVEFSPRQDASNVQAPRPRARRAERAAATERTELQISEMFVARAAERYRYCGPLGGWYRWTGTHWELDVRESYREAAKDVARELAEEAAATLDEHSFAAAKRAGSARGISAILELARSSHELVFGPDEADRDPWALNCLNGTINLRTGELRPHDRRDLITRVCPVHFDASADAPRFAQFLEDVQPNESVRGYLARLVGYAAVGLVGEHVIGVFWGPGANGKSVLADVVTHVLGEYARPGAPSLIVSNGNHEPHPTDIASCVGSRLVIVHETRRGAGFDASKIKLLTGGDRLTARHMREDFFEFRPSHTIVMLSNYRPQADASDAALWRRVQLVPFDVVVPEERRDPLLSEKLRGEAPGILRWIVEGALEWQRIGLAPPAVIRDQTAAYRAAEDVLGEFLEECTDRLPQASVKAGVLYAAYRTWSEAGGHRTLRSNDFAAEIVARGFGRERNAAGRVYRGLGLRTFQEGGAEHG